MKLKKIKSYRNEWFCENLRRLKADKIRLYEIAKLSSSETEWNGYKTARNRYKSAIQEAKNKYITGKIDNSHDQKTMWRTLKQLVLKEDVKSISEIVYNNSKYKDNLKMASILNSYFLSSIT